ncbi:alpha/beta fold hydrolase [Corynebacterium guangdongense]|uniref:Pimeloyl-ACP methyl ester carboxylesterase n=1 Tax=Corynebacterium guangdongense TaxID=1783348 RepID=A0ABU1ZZD2_9CORY|nr:alpha/beta fold hydrolase [Corynebacterium guangdongense]MDR7330266.1 pimeloyl-ACP methyl ester carboxylesterase [Corynebacterium guangdongense]WJZ18824.1 Tropinesterase [Corynebacterium guangdongense]
MLARITAGDPRAPQILLVHGVGDCAAGFAELVDALSATHHVIAVDQRGHGHSPRFTRSGLAGNPFAQLRDDLITVLEGLDRPVVWGHSMGGAVATEAAIARPELVSRLILEDPAWVDRPPAQTARIGRARARSIDEDLADLPAALARQLAQGWSFVETAAWAAGRTQVQREFVETGIVSAGRGVAASVDKLVASGVDAHVLTGTGMTCILGARGAEAVRAGGLRAEVITGAEHCVRRTRPSETRRAVWVDLGA